LRRNPFIGIPLGNIFISVIVIIFNKKLY